MAKSNRANMSSLRDFALSLADVEESVACAGTSLERKSFKVRKKTFLFLGDADAMLKLATSLPAASKLAAAGPDRYQVGAHGWTTIKIGKEDKLPNTLLEDWVRESYSLFAPKPKKTK